MEQQNNIVTLTKAMGIILMVFAHAMPPDHILWMVIYTFHMPLFFIMSGYCFKEKYLDDAKQFVVRKIKGIYVPFVAFSMVFLALHNVFCKLYIYEPTWLYGWKNYLWETSRIVTRMSHAGGMLGTFWFLKELFLGNLIFYGAMRLSRKFKMKGKWVTIIGLFALAEIMCIFQLRIPYFGVSYVSVRTACLIAFGYIWKQRDWHIDNWWLWLGGIAVIAIDVYLDRGGYLTTLPLRLLIYYIPAVAGTMMTYELCRRIVNSRWLIVKRIEQGLVFIGQHTLAIMALHLLSFKLVTYGIIRVHHLSIDRLYEFPVLYDYINGWSVLLIYTLVGLCIPLICAVVWQWGIKIVKSEK